MLKATIVQHAVGQGGLCVGEVSCGGEPLRWVYDCGSNQADALGREIRRIRGPLDLLFLSHLDNDHVNGVDLLLCARDCVEVVLPYLEDEERLLVLAETEDGHLSGQFVEFMGDPTAWLGRRGVKRVTFVRGRDDGDTATDAPPDGGRDGEGRLTAKWSRPRMAVAMAPGIDAGVVEAGAILTFSAAWGGAVDWVLAPQVYPPPPARAKAFGDQLALRFPGKTPQQIASEAWTSAGRSNLRACYETIWADHNKVSMSLYAGPSGQVAGGWNGEIGGGQGDDSVRMSIQHVPFGLGWISTGDADLGGVRRRNAFLGAYSRYLKTTAVFVTPHHGAGANFHPALLTGMHALIAGVAAAGNNGYHHPNDIVRDAINALPFAGFAHVNEVDGSSLSLSLETA